MAQLRRTKQAQLRRPKQGGRAVSHMRRPKQGTLPPPLEVEPRAQPSKMTMRPQMAAMGELERCHNAAAPAMVLESRLPDGA